MTFRRATDLRYFGAQEGESRDGRLRPDGYAGLHAAARARGQRVVP